MRFVAGLVLSLALSVVPALAGQKAKSASAPRFEKSEDVLKWINSYRQHPDPQRLPEAVKAMGDFGLFRDLDGAGVYIGFTGGVIGAEGEKADQLVARMFPMPPEDQVVLIRAIAFSGLPNWKALLAQFVERMPARQVLLEKYLFGDGKALFDLPMQEGAFVLDAHWGYYFATGSPEAVHRIVSALALSRDKDNLENLTIGAMAKWTLATNASRDKELLDLAKAEMNGQPETVRSPLREVLLAAETFETAKIRKDALASIEELKTKGSETARNISWWGQAGQTVLALGCVAAGALGQVEVGIPCVVGGALSTAALKYLTPQ